MNAFRRVATAVALIVATAGVATASPFQGTITSISPNSGPTAGGTTVEITGTMLWGAFGPTVTIGGVTATEVSRSGYAGVTEQITVTTPPHAAGAVDVVVSEYGSESARVDRGFTYVDPAPVATGPTVSAITPPSGLTTGSEPVTITGTRFRGDTAPTVTIGGVAATGVTVVDDTTITATTPEHAAGRVDVTVARGTDVGTLAGGFTYDQGYWLTVKTMRPADIGGLASPGAVRTPGFGDWSVSNSKTVTKVFPIGRETTTTHTGYAGGINCGARTVERKQILLFPSSVESWEAGKCRYAFRSGAQVGLTALPSSYDFGLSVVSVQFKGGFLGAWRSACAGVTTDTCTVRMTADSTATAVWGFANLVLGGIVGNVVYPTYNARGELEYYNASGLFLRPPSVVGGTPTYWFGVTIPAKAASATEHAAANRRSQVVCRTEAHVQGKRLTARCPVTPVLARALRRGTVRSTSTWYVRMPHSSVLQPMARGHLMLRGRRASAVTG